MKSTLQTFLLGAGFGAAFLLGQYFSPAAGPNRAANDDGPVFGGPVLEAQGRGGSVPAPPTTQPEPAPAADDQIVYTEEHSSSMSANGFLAVTGSYGVGTSVMYLVDTVNRQLAVYEARGGSAEQRRIVLVGARRLDLDLQLHGYNDRSEYEYSDLEKLFAKRRPKARNVDTGQPDKKSSRK